MPRGADRGRATDGDVSVLTPKEKPKRTPPKMVPFRASEDLIKEIDEAANELGLSRNEAMTQLIRYALAEHRKERAKKRGSKEH